MAALLAGMQVDTPNMLVVTAPPHHDDDCCDSGSGSATVATVATAATATGATAATGTVATETAATESAATETQLASHEQKQVYALTLYLTLVHLCAVIAQPSHPALLSSHPALLP